jgi:hypothetical protein
MANTSPPVLGYPIVDRPATPAFALDTGGSPIKTNGTFPATLKYPGHLKRLSSALAKGAHTQANILVMGTSIPRGCYSNDVSGVDNEPVWKQKSFVTVAQKTLDGRYGKASAGAIFPVTPIGAGSGGLFTLAGGAASNGPSLYAGLGGFRVDLTSSAHTISFAVSGTVCRVWGFAVAAGITARYQVSSDGGSTFGTLTDFPTTSSGVTPTGTQYWYSADLPLGADGDYVVRIQAPASGAFYPYAFCGYTDTTKGVVLHRAGYPGKVLVEMFSKALDATDTAGPIWRTSLNDNQKLMQAQSITTRMGMNAAIIMVDVNDVTQGWSAYGYNLTDIRRHAQNTADWFTSNGMDVVFAVGPWRNSSSYASGVPFTQADAMAQYDAVAACTDGVGLLDFTTMWADYATGNAAGQYVDTVHPNSTGHGTMGTQLGRLLLAL